MVSQVPKILSRTYCHRPRFISHVCTTNQVACVCVCVCLRVHLFFGAGPAQGVFFSGCWSIVVSGISGHPSDWVFPRSGLDPSFRDEKMRKCMKSWRALLECFVVKSAERRFAP